MSGNYSGAEETIERVLSGSEYNRGEMDTVKLDWLKDALDKVNEYLDKMFRAIGDWLEKMFSKVNINFGEGGGSGSPKMIAKIIVIVLVVAAVVALTILLIKLLKRGKRKKLAYADDRELAEYSQNPDAALALAEKYRAEGQTRLSFRYLFINLLTELNKREIIKIARYKTNRSYFREVQSSKKADVARIKTFFDTFNRVWYGGKSLGVDDLDAFFESRTSILEAFDARGSEDKAADVSSESSPKTGKAGGSGNE